MDRSKRPFVLWAGISLLVFLCLVSAGVAKTKKAAPPKQVLAVINPTNGETVDCEYTAQGNGARSTDTVWFVIHPFSASGYWVQNKPSVNKGGTFQALVYFGRKGMDVGQKFEIRAVRNPQKPLEAGMELSDWPKGEELSDTVTVTRE